MDLIAHRGNSCSAPENTMAAFRQVPNSGARGVEFDVQASLDGVPVVIHDELLRRTTGSAGQVGELTLQELRELDAGQWFATEFRGERIPTLAETLDWLRQTTLQINIELKTNQVEYPGLNLRVIELVQSMKLEKRVVVSSFNHLTLKATRDAAPQLEYAALSSDQLLEPWDYVKRYGFQAYHPAAHAVTEELVQRCHQAGLSVRVWTVDDPEQARLLGRLGVDAIFTNHPARISQAIAAPRS